MNINAEGLPLAVDMIDVARARLRPLTAECIRWPEVQFNAYRALGYQVSGGETVNGFPCEVDPGIGKDEILLIGAGGEVLGRIYNLAKMWRRS